MKSLRLLFLFFMCNLHLLTAAEPVVRELGVPVKAVNWVRLHPGRGPDGQPSLLASMGQNNGGLFVLDIDLATGKCQQFNAPAKEQQYPTASFRSPHTGILYVGEHTTGHLLRYDPAHSERGLEDLGVIDGTHATFPTGISEAPDGGIWIGGYPDASLTRYDPATGEFKHFGSLDDTDKYLYPLVGSDGTIAALTKVVHPHLVVVDPQTGAKKSVGPVANADDKTQTMRFFKGLDGFLYFDTFQGKFRVKGMELEPVAFLPADMPGIHATSKHAYQEVLPMPGGWIAAWADGDDTPESAGVFQKITLTNTAPGIPSRELTLDWQGGGSNLFVLHAGADGMIYGSSFLPEHFFRIAPDGSGMINFGRCSEALGEAYSIADFSDGTMLIGSYSGGYFSAYDPKKPYRFGLSATGNPRSLGRLDTVGIRPVGMAVTPSLKKPDGTELSERGWSAMLPDYGTWGGTLAWVDPKTGEHASHRHLLPDLSPFSLLWLPGQKQLLVGLSIEGGTGTKPKASHGGFALWDPIEDKAVYTGDFGVKNMQDVLALAPADHGLVYALLGHTRYTKQLLGDEAAGPLHLALVDPAARKVLKIAALPAAAGREPEQVQYTLFRGPDGIYGMTEKSLYRVKPGTCDIEVVWTAPQGDQLDTPGPWIGRIFYFATGWRLRTLTLP